MGFTRYFNGNVTLTPSLIEDVLSIVEEAKVTLNGWDGTGSPTISVDELYFNGSDAAGEAYEIFLIKNGDQFGFCKTNEQPYDLVIATILRRIEATNPGFKHSSDGGYQEDKVSKLYSTLFS